jgi:hypothetical protein
MSMLAGRTVLEGKTNRRVAPARLPEKLEFSGDFTGMSGDFTALPENVPGEIYLPVAGNESSKIQMLHQKYPNTHRKNARQITF